MGQREMRGEGGEVNVAAGTVAVRVIDQKSAAWVVDDVVVGIVSAGADMELAGRQDAAVTDPSKDRLVEQDLVDMDGEVRDTVEIEARAEIGAENELVLAAAAGQRTNTGSAIERIIPGSANQAVVARATEQVVGPAAAGEAVVAAFTEDVAGGPAGSGEDIIAGIKEDIADDLAVVDYDVWIDRAGARVNAADQRAVIIQGDLAGGYGDRKMVAAKRAARGIVDGGRQPVAGEHPDCVTVGRDLAKIVDDAAVYI